MKEATSMKQTVLEKENKLTQEDLIKIHTALTLVYPSEAKAILSRLLVGLEPMLKK